MKKIIYLFLLLSNISLSNVFDFLQTSFNANVTEISIVNSNKKTKEFKLSYSKDKLELTILKPELNKGEVYTYSKGKKTLYSPKLKQSVNQSINSQDESLYSILNELANLKESKTFEKDGKKYVFENNILKNITAKNYIITFEEYLNNKPSKIRYKSNSMEFEYNIKY